MCTEESERVGRDNRGVSRNARFVAATVLGIVLTVGATVWAIAESQDTSALELEELLQVEDLPDASASRLDEQFVRTMEFFNGRQWTEEEYEARFTEQWVSAISREAVNQGLDEVLGDLGTLRFVRVVERTPNLIAAATVAEDGTGLLALAGIDDDGRMDTMGLEGVNLGSRLPGWATGLAVAAACVFLGSAVVAWRSGGEGHAWALLVATLVPLGTMLLLSDAELGYTIGRVAPALAVAVGASLLLDPRGGRLSTWLLGGAVVAAVVGALAPMARDAALIGHPDVLGAFANDETLYRVLLAISAGLVALVMAGVAVVHVRSLEDAGRWARPAGLAAVVVAVVWAASGLGSTLDFSLGGDGALAGGVLAVSTWAAFAAVPAVTAFGVASLRWDSTELASLVIDLESEGSDLQPAVARALEDPSLQILMSEDGETLVDDAGVAVAVDDLPAGRTLTQLRSRGTLVGGLVHDASLDQHGRLHAVAAATGLALEVGRLNRQVLAQLDDVTASRARIVQASDAARRRVERDLHDGAQQRLVALGLTLQRARRMATVGGLTDQAELLEGTVKELRDVIDDIRSVSRGSHPALLAERGLVAAVDALAERAPVPVRIDIDPDELPTEVATTIYFVVAEALTNIAKHAGATTANVSIVHVDGSARVGVTDDGGGGAVLAPGSGLQGLDDRVAAAGGSFTIRSGPEGTTLEATIPCG